MAMNLGMKTTKLWFVPNGDFSPNNNLYENGFNHLGVWVGGDPAPTENQFLDLGIIVDEREELTMGGIAFSTPGTGTNARIFWAVGGKVLRVTISGIIPDGFYHSTDSAYNNKSNASVFKYKLNKNMAYQDITDAFINLHSVRYRRKMLIENTDEVAKWIMTSYSISHIQGTRNLQYTITLDQANNPLSIKSGINTRAFGEVL